MNWTEGDYMSPEEEYEQEARAECARRGLDPDDDAADGVSVWMVVDQEIRGILTPEFCERVLAATAAPSASHTNGEGQ